MASDDLVSMDDAITIGLKITEMADRVKVANKYMPGAEAKWSFDLDDTKFQVTVTVKADG